MISKLCFNLSGTLKLFSLQAARLDGRDGEVLFYNNLPYARAHNEGFQGTVNVRAHSRKKFGKVRVGDIKTRQIKTVKTDIGEAQISGHIRKANIVQRQFAPYEGNESPILIAAITKELEQQIKNILTF